MRQYLYLFGALFVLNVIMAVGYVHVVNQTDGTWVYPLDDTYIHMQIARNIADNGYYGYTNNEFCSTSSSPLYTGLLAVCHKLFGGNILTPLVINVIFANILVVGLFSFFKRRIAFFLLMFISLLTPVLLPAQVFNGMEHTMHIVLITLTLIIYYKLLHHDFRSGGGKILLMLLCCTLCLTRYESMFFIVALSFVLVIIRQYKLSLCVFCSGVPACCCLWPILNVSRRVVFPEFSIRKR